MRSVRSFKPVQAHRPMLAGRRVLARRATAVMRAMAAMLGGHPGAGAVADPYRAGAQHAAQLSGSRQIGAVPGPQHEVLSLARQVTAGMPACRDPAIGRARLPRNGEQVRAREAVVGIRPCRGLLPVEPGLTDRFCQQGELVAAALADCRERNRVPCQRERYLVRPPRTIMTGHCCHGQHGSINAA